MYFKDVPKKNVQEDNKFRAS